MIRFMILRGADKGHLKSFGVASCRTKLLKGNLNTGGEDEGFQTVTSEVAGSSPVGSAIIISKLKPVYAGFFFSCRPM